MIFIGILVSIIVFSVIILVHEYGHFKSARIFGVKVEEFGLGIPPHAKTLFTDKKGTKFTLNYLPFGGFVKLKGENLLRFDLYNEKKQLLSSAELENAIKNKTNIYTKDGNILTSQEIAEVSQLLEQNTAPDSLLNKPAWQQAIIILAGVVMNFLLAALIYTGLFWYGVQPIGINSQIQTNVHSKIIPTQADAIRDGLLVAHSGILVSPAPESIAQKAGLLNNDAILKVNETSVDSYETFRDALAQFKNTSIQLEIRRNNTTQTISITPSSEGKIGAYIGPNIVVNKDFQYKYSLIPAIKYGFIETYAQIRLTWSGMKMLFQKIFHPKDKQERKEAIEQVSGPIGIVSFISQSFSNGIIFILIIGATISINLGVFNLLPIPALDGGRFLFITINGAIGKLFGRKLFSDHIESYIHVTFFIFLIAISLIIAYNDIVKILTQ